MTDYNDKLKLIYENAKAFYDKLDAWIKEEKLEPSVVFSKEYVKEEMFEWHKQDSLAKNYVVKKYISSTHTWVLGKNRWSKKNDNWLQSPYECKVCHMGGSSYDDIGVAGREKVTDIPTRDMHNHLISRTCQEVLDARTLYRKKRKGTKCYQCSTYGCSYKI